MSDLGDIHLTLETIQGSQGEKNLGQPVSIHLTSIAPKHLPVGNELNWEVSRISSLSLFTVISLTAKTPAPTQNSPWGPGISIFLGLKQLAFLPNLTPQELKGAGILMSLWPGAPHCWTGWSFHPISASSPSALTWTKQPIDSVWSPRSSSTSTLQDPGIFFSFLLSVATKVSLANVGTPYFYPPKKVSPSFLCPSHLSL